MNAILSLELSSSPWAIFGAILAQAPAPTTTTDAVSNPLTGFLAAMGLAGLGSTVLNLIGAIIILIVGWIVSAIVSGIVKNLLKRTDIDNRLVGSVMGTRGGSELKIENIIGTIVFWVLMILTIVAFLNALQLTMVAILQKGKLLFWGVLPQELPSEWQLLEGGLWWLGAMATKIEKKIDRFLFPTG